MGRLAAKGTPGAENTESFLKAANAFASMATKLLGDEVIDEPEKRSARYEQMQRELFNDPADQPLVLEIITAAEVYQALLSKWKDDVGNVVKMCS